MDSTPTPAGNLYTSSAGVMGAFSPPPLPLLHPSVCCNAARSPGQFLHTQARVYTEGRGAAGEGSNGASLGKVTLFPLVLN